MSEMVIMKSTKVTIGDVLRYRIAPFEINDDKLKSLFSYFLHLAPTIESCCTKSVEDSKLSIVWGKFVEDTGFNKDNYHIYASGYIIGNQLEKYNLAENKAIGRKEKGCICYRKEKDEKDINCFLRHLRNSIAHGNVFLYSRNRKYILMDDYNKEKHLTARILLAQVDLARLRKLIDSVGG